MHVHLEKVIWGDPSHVCSIPCGEWLKPEKKDAVEQWYVKRSCLRHTDNGKIVLPSKWCRIPYAIASAGSGSSVVSMVGESRKANAS
jgi:hypothetical protein